jgi:signal transduction histidine kinase
MRGYSFYLLLLLCLPAYSQNEAEPEPLIRWYQRFFETEQTSSIEDALAANDDRLLQAMEIQDYAEQSRIYLANGLLHLTRTSNYDSAMGFFLQALVMQDSLNLTEEKIMTSLAIAQVFEDVGDYYKSAQFLDQALTLNAGKKDAAIQVVILNELGKVNVALGKLDEAFMNYQQVLEMKDILGDASVEADALFNLAALVASRGEYSKALEHYKQALALRRSVRDRQGEARTLNEIGYVYGFLKNQDRARANHVAALEVFTELHDARGTAMAYNSVGVLDYQQKNYQRAVENLQLGLAAAREAQAKELIRTSVEYLSHTYKALGDYQKALAYSEELLLIDDFIQNERSERQLLETQNRYVIDQKETQIDKLEAVRAQREKEIAEQKKIRNFLFGLIGLGVIIVVLILYLYLVKRRSNRALQAANERVEQQNKELQTLNATKDKFFSILGHDLKGPLNSLTSFSQLLINYFDSLSKEEIQMLAKDLDKSVKNLFALLDNLLEWARSQTGAIQFTPVAFDISEVLKENQDLLQAQAGAKQIAIHIHDPHPVPVQAHKPSITTVIRNLTANAIKFTPAGGTITLHAMQDKKETVVSITDTGVGMSPAVMEKLFRLDSKHSTLGTAQEKGTGLGLILCKDFVEKNGGRIWVESKEGKGSVFYFTIPNS